MMAYLPETHWGTNNSKTNLTYPQIDEPPSPVLLGSPA